MYYGICRDRLRKSKINQSMSRKKNCVLPIEKLHFCVQARNTIMLEHLIIHFSLHYLSIGRLYGRLKTKEHFKLLGLKVNAVAYERWSPTRGSKYSDLT